MNMKLRNILILLLGIFLAKTALAQDLTKIDRTIRKEPTYSSKSPKYCLLVIGPDAKTRVWLVLDRDVLYIDRNGNGDITEPGERVTQHEGPWLTLLAGNVLDADGKTEHTNITATYFTHENRTIVSVAGSVGGKQRFTSGLVPFADRPSDAPIIHFGGALQMHIINVFKSQSKPESRNRECYVSVGTPGLGSETFAGLHHDSIPRHVDPIAEIEFSPIQPGNAAIKRKVRFKSRSNSTNFHETIEVPENAAMTRAKVTFSFPDYPEGKVTPVTKEIEIPK